jgi:hypothetical protein
MSEDIAPLTEAQKFRALLHIQRALGREEHPTLRACGLTETVAQAVAAEEQPSQIVDLWIVADDGSVLDRCRIDKISDTGLGILAMGELAEPPPVRISVEHLPMITLPPRGLDLGNRLWEILLIVIGIPVAIFVGWFLWKHHWN